MYSEYSSSWRYMDALQAGPSPNKEIVTQFIGIGFYTFYSTFLKTYVAQPRKKIYLSLLRKLEAFAQ